ncbi:alkylation response protein AidB-like acyl-CoA dehydrogenase [Scopulibacillus darangshiensis]|uniref:Alkylation response protein AidB-like acyl-CoA dehydrogenase n=1 Tax=Scopulibacillus darangshiensis TaxID=442528 RepID=A0A4R2NZH1_9BACL|nr:acyl-CoA dehydrogenase family protein [Scopulibacillus darangshiensis]TCP27054.1 alkylation response protein AidB-like acyl-CoA dehydrogenase [Scopulibacillus darangshiensis]
MFDKDHVFIKTARQKELYELARSHAEDFSRRADHYDETGDFPFENFEALKASGYTGLTASEEYGGKNISLYELVLIQEALAQGDGPTTLGIGWHLGIMMDLSLRREWDEETFKALCRRVINDKHIVNRAATEQGTGSPTRGGKPATEAGKEHDGWRVTGHKTFTTLAPVADEFIVTASMKDSDDVGGFLVNRHLDGVSFEETWDTLGMRATRSDDLFLKNVKIPPDAFVERIGWQDKNHLPPGWLLHIPACYIGIALAARRDVIDFAANYQPNSLDHPIKDLQHVQQKIGAIELELMKARYMMYGVAEQWDRDPERRPHLGPELSAVKYTATNAAVKAVDLAMRVVGGTSIFRSKPFERYYRDVRAGIHNPPSDDAVLSILGKRGFQES